MSAELIPFAIGFLFGGGLLLAGLADPDKIIGTLRLKDFHAMRTIGIFVLVGMLGTWILDMAGVANYDIKPATVVSILLGGALLGIGFGMTGFCPGTGLACGAAGRLDALVAVAGMFAGALAFILLYPSVGAPLEEVANYGKTTLPEVTGISKTIWVLVFCGGGFVALFLTRPRHQK